MGQGGPVVSATLAVQVQAALVACTILAATGFLARRTVRATLGYLAAIPLSWTVARYPRRFSRPARYRGRHARKGRHHL